MTKFIILMKIFSSPSMITGFGIKRSKVRFGENSYQNAVNIYEVCYIWCHFVEAEKSEKLHL